MTFVTLIIDKVTLLIIIDTLDFQISKVKRQLFVLFNLLHYLVLLKLKRTNRFM